MTTAAALAAMAVGMAIRKVTPRQRVAAGDNRRKLRARSPEATPPLETAVTGNLNSVSPLAVLRV